MFYLGLLISLISSKKSRRAVKKLVPVLNRVITRKFSLHKFLTKIPTKEERLNIRKTKNRFREKFDFRGFTVTLKISKLLVNLLLCCYVLVFLFFLSLNRYFCVLENSCLNRWFSQAYFKVAVFVYSGPKSSEVTCFLLVIDVILKWVIIPVRYLWGSPVLTEVADFIFPFSGSL